MTDQDVQEICSIGQDEIDQVINAKIAFIRYGIEIKRFRESIGLTQADFGNEIGVSNSTISLWESGERKPRRCALMVIEQLKKRYILQDGEVVIAESA